MHQSATHVDDATLARVATRLEAQPGLHAAYLLGSAARGAMRADSDVDVAVMLAPGRRLSGVPLLELGAELTEIVHRSVDLGIVGSENLVYARQALLAGRRFLCRDRAAVELAEATLLGLAAQLDYERREIVHAYTA